MTNFTFHTMENSSTQVQELFSGIQKNYGFIPNLFAYMAEAPTTIEAYLALDNLISNTSFTPAQQQTALLAVSIENSCDFCSVAHRAMGKMKNASVQTMDALNTQTKISDPQDHALATFAQSITKKRGRPDKKELDAFLDAGFTKQQIFEVILIVSIKTLSNYINHLTNPEANEELLANL